MRFKLFFKTLKHFKQHNLNNQRIFIGAIVASGTVAVDQFVVFPDGKIKSFREGTVFSKYSNKEQGHFRIQYRTRPSSNNVTSNNSDKSGIINLYQNQSNTNNTREAYLFIIDEYENRVLRAQMQTYINGTNTNNIKNKNNKHNKPWIEINIESISYKDYSSMINGTYKGFNLSQDKLYAEAVFNTLPNIKYSNKKNKNKSTKNIKSIKYERGKEKPTLNEIEEHLKIDAISEWNGDEFSALNLNCQHYATWIFGIYTGIELPLPDPQIILGQENKNIVKEVKVEGSNGNIKKWINKNGSKLPWVKGDWWMVNDNV